MLVAMLAVMGYALLWVSWKQGRVVATSAGPQGSTALIKVQVRKVPSSAPWWALPLLFVPDESPSFRCELYQRGSNVLFSSQTIRGVSYSSFDEITIEWRDKAEAIVYFNSDAMLSCDTAGVWRVLK
jgi:hypothetical protein